MHIHADHVRIMDGSEYKCPKKHCGKLFPNRETMRAHIEAHYQKRHLGNLSFASKMRWTYCAMIFRGWTNSCDSNWRSAHISSVGCDRQFVPQSCYIFCRRWVSSSLFINYAHRVIFRVDPSRVQNNDAARTLNGGANDNKTEGVRSMLTLESKRRNLSNLQKMQLLS